MLEYMLIAVILIGSLLFLGRDILKKIKGADSSCSGCNCDGCGGNLKHTDHVSAKDNNCSIKRS